MTDSERTLTSRGSDVAVHQPFSFVRKLFWKRPKLLPDKCLRTVVANSSVPDNVPPKHHPHRGYSDNKIRTTKYTVLSFIPKNLFEQFHRFANLYFIGIVLLNWVPKINAFGKEIAIIPVVFVLGVTAIKDWFEDFRRYKSDKRVNNLTCRVYSREANRYVKTLWKHVRVGDIVHLSNNEVIPADILLLRCSDEQGLCYIETANLDGESNLKQREVPRGFLAQANDFDPASFHCKIECDSPNHKIYRFNGCIAEQIWSEDLATNTSLYGHKGLHFCKRRKSGGIELSNRNNRSRIIPPGERVVISKENLLLRDCVLKNADFVEGLVVYAGHETKAMLNNDGPRYKRSKLEKLMNKDVVFCIFILILLCLLGALGNGIWLSSFNDRSNVPFLLYDNSSDPSWSEVPKESFLVFWTFVIVLQVMIPLSLYVTVEIIKLGQVYFIHEDVNLYDSISNKRLECRALNITEELGQVEYIFSDKTGTLTENNMVFRRCTIGGIDYNHDRPRDHANLEGGDPALYTSVECRKANGLKNGYVLNPILQEELSKMEIQLRVDSSPVEIIHLSPHNQRIQDFFLLLAVCNTVVVSKYPHKDQMNSSGLFLNTSTPASVRHIGWGETWEIPQERFCHLLSYSSTPTSSAASTPIKRPHHLGIPHLGFYSSSPSRSSTPTPTQFQPIYEAESPDEIALVDLAFSYNCRLLKRSPEAVLLSLPGEGMIEFHFLHVLPFDSTRKRMSVILEHPFTHQKILYCKGADSTVLPLLAPVHSQEMRDMIMKTQQQLNSYSRKGLRVLCMAKKVLSNEEYEKWAIQHKEAEFCMGDKESKLFESACSVETNLELLGATGIEDRLQDGVPQAIASLRAAGIVVWVLTGDKQETAVNIAYSCKLFTTDMEIITLNARSKESAEDTIRFYLDQIEKDLGGNEASSPCPVSASYMTSILFRHGCVQGTSRRKKPRALVIDGRTLMYVLDKPLDNLFLKLSQYCVSVLCCRATPLQKASVVKLVKESVNALTLAIGDGANDVSMIQTADVGIGISGKEGMQAVMASDFALARFCYLERLLLVHGHWCYDRLARTILYFFYKNASFIFLICWYQWFCGFSANVMIDQIYLMLFNVLFLSLPPIVLGILDKNCPEDILLQYPYLYAQGRNAEIHTKYSFWINMLDAIYQSIITFFIPFIAYNDSTVGIWEFGTTICTACILVQLLHLAIETRSWTYLHVLAIVLSLVIYFGFVFVYNCVPQISVGMQGFQNPYWVIIEAATSAVFWSVVVLVPVLSCLPRLVLRAVQGSLFPNDVTTVLHQLKKTGSDSDRSTISVSWSRESSGSSSDFDRTHHGDAPSNVRQTTHPVSDDAVESTGAINFICT